MHAALNVIDIKARRQRHSRVELAVSE
ncbi:MAG: hypothetical protein JWN34_3195, partial [Bryobacterales bacterium]|nr:hypothetical protein [Bryobacterales bacterium]